MKRFSHVCFLLASLFVLAAFKINNAIVPKDEILSGGPPKDGIPAILNPRFISPGEAGFLKLDDEVTGVRAEGQAKAYPIKILNWHEVVNDTIGAIPIVVTF